LPSKLIELCVTGEIYTVLYQHEIRCHIACESNPLLPSGVSIPFLTITSIRFLRQKIIIVSVALISAAISDLSTNFTPSTRSVLFQTGLHSGFPVDRERRRPYRCNPLCLLLCFTKPVEAVSCLLIAALTPPSTRRRCTSISSVAPPRAWRIASAASVVP